MTPAPCLFEEDVLLLEDGELEFERRIVVEAHLGLCADCAALEEALDVAVRVLRETPEEPLGAAEAALDALEARRRPAPIPLFAALAAAAVLVVAVWPRGDDAPAPIPPRTATVVEQPDPADPLPPPRRHGPPVRRLLAELDPDAPGYAADVEALAARVARGGAARTSELGRLLDPAEPDTTARALDVALHLRSRQLVPGLTALLDVEAFAATAARHLGALEAHGTVPALERALDGPAAAEARDALARIGTSAAYEVLSRRALAGRAAESGPLLDAAVRAEPGTGARLLLDLLAAEETRDDARRVLERHRETLLEPLRRLARTGGTLVAAGAVEALGLVRDEGAVPLLHDLVRQRGTDRAAACALARIGTHAALLVVVRHADRDGVAAGLEGIAEAEGPLLDVVATGNTHEQETALELLDRCGGAATVRALAYGNLRRGLHVTAAATLGRIGGDAAADVLAGYAIDPGLHDDLVGALAATRSARAVAPLQRLARGPRTPHVARALGKIEDAAAARALLELLVDVRAAPAAADALAGLPARVVVPILIDELEEAPRRRRLQALLARITGADHGAAVQRWKSWWADQS